MFQWLVECVYNYCCGIRQKHKDKLHNAIYAIEDLSQNEYNKLMRIYNKCC